MGFFEERDSASLIGRLTSQVPPPHLNRFFVSFDVVLRPLVSSSFWCCLCQVEQLQPLIQFVPNMITTFGKLGMFSYYLFSASQFAILSLFGLLYLPFFFLYAEWSGKFWLKWQLPLQKSMIEIYSVLAEHLQNIPTIKAFNGYKVASQSLVAQVPSTFIRARWYKRSCCAADKSVCEAQYLYHLCHETR
jgi:ABC-type multidrug transport system fused ATPase/permease subunit